MVAKPRGAVVICVAVASVQLACRKWARRLKDSESLPNPPVEAKEPFLAPFLFDGDPLHHTQSVYSLSQYLHRISGYAPLMT